VGRNVSNSFRIEYDQEHHNKDSIDGSMSNNINRIKSALELKKQKKNVAQRPISRKNIEVTS